MEEPGRGDEFPSLIETDLLLDDVALVKDTLWRGKYTPPIMKDRW
jgi:hypothetical protein